MAGVAKSFGGRTLFAEVSLQVNREDRIGLVGPNGAGKTTLFSLILQAVTADEGTISLQRGTTIGYLPQEMAPAEHETVLDLAAAISPEMSRLQQILNHAGPEQEHSAEYHDAQVRFQEMGGFHLRARAKKILAGLGFRETDFARPCRELSGGWVMRTHLARLLVQEPDLLMLDEPTNHLDLESLLWFQDYLKTYPGALLLISHDREFLNQLVGSVVEIRQGKLIRYRGNYDEYLAQRAAHEEQTLAAFKNQQREIAHLMEFVDRFRAKNTKAAQAQSKLKQIERMDKIEAPSSEERKINFEFPQPPRSGRRVVTLANLRHAYGDKVVYSDLDFAAERGQRIVLVGPNGAGKSTLLKLLAGVLAVQAGTRELGYHVRSGYFAQHRAEMLNPERTVLEEGLDTPQRVTEQFVRTVLGSFLFRGDDVFKKVKVLSGGEKSRLALVKLLLDPPNLLLMDEPTTHLDIPSIDALLGALEQFEGTLIFISHDVYFIRAMANRVVHVHAGHLTHYAGDYQYYLDKTAAVSERAGLTAGGELANGAPVGSKDRPSLRNKEQKRIEAELRQARSRQRREQQQLVDQLEAEIAALEERQAGLTRELENPETYEKSGRAMEVNRELLAILDRLKQCTTDWETAAAKLIDLDSKSGCSLVLGTTTRREGTIRASG